MFVKIGRVVDKFNMILFNAVAVLLVLLAIAITVNSITRIFNFHFVGLLDVARLSLLWIGFCGAAWMLRKDGHVSVDVVTAKLNPKAGAMLDIITCSINLVVSGLLVWATAMVTVQHFQTHFIMADSILQLPKAPLEIIIPLGSLLLVIELIRKIAKKWNVWKVPARRSENA
jgi:C4-dicarboxylate transporter, DctQ subunit